MINGDNTKGIINRLLYFPQCIYNHNKGKKFDVVVKSPKLDIKKVYTCSGSPSRITCDVFWKSINYKIISDTIGNKINFFDIGTGKGEYGTLLKNVSESSFGSYTGIDIYKNINFPDEFTHILDEAVNTNKYISDHTNFIISQSTLEHVRQDFLVIKNSVQMFKEMNSKFIQIHMVPSAPSLVLYLWHGWRQYSLKNLSHFIKKIEDINDQVDAYVIPIGGPRGFFYHLKNITLMTVIGKLGRYFLPMKESKNLVSNKVNSYEQCHNAVTSDLINKSNHLNTFWALIIKHKEVDLRFINDDTKSL
ncbi:hypothetical protein OBA27_00665 [Pelagibacteraceae bacterium]|nr:hypothetical protein [Pelagibacteraceae bacterium]